MSYNIPLEVERDLQTAQNLIDHSIVSHGVCIVNYRESFDNKIIYKISHGSTTVRLSAVDWTLLARKLAPTYRINLDSTKTLSIRHPF